MPVETVEFVVGLGKVVHVYASTEGYNSHINILWELLDGGSYCSLQPLQLLLRHRQIYQQEQTSFPYLRLYVFLCRIVAYISQQGVVGHAVVASPLPGSFVLLGVGVDDASTLSAFRWTGLVCGGLCHEGGEEEA